MSYRVFSHYYESEALAWARCPAGALGATVKFDSSCQQWELRYWI